MNWRFFCHTIAWSVVAVAIALLGVHLGPGILVALGANETQVNLQTMGELLGGTAGFAVAFAGAFVAFIIAKLARRHLDLQERREAHHTANQTLGKSIGRILEIQSEFEAVLRFAECLGQLVDSKDQDEMKQIKQIRKNLLKSAKKLSGTVQVMLADPLALSVLFALHKERSGEDQVEQVLRDISQLPRWLDTLLVNVADDQQYNKHFLLRWHSCYDAVLRMKNYLDRERDEELARGLDLGLALKVSNLFKSGDEGPTKVLSYLCYLTDEDYESPVYEIHEPRLIGLLRYFAYSPQQAEKALRRTFREIYPSSDILDLVLSLGPATAFRNSGYVNDDLAIQLLQDSQRITRCLRDIFTHREAPPLSVKAIIKALALETMAEADAERGIEAGRRLEYELDTTYLPKEITEDDRERAYRNYVLHPLLARLINEADGFASFTVYRILFDHFGEYKREGLSVVDFFTSCMQRFVVTRAEKDLQRRIQEASRADAEDSPLRGSGEVLRVEIAKLCRLAEEADALDELRSTRLPASDIRDVKKFFDELHQNLQERIIETVLHEATDEEKREICGCLGTRRLWSNAVKRAALALRHDLEEHGLTDSALPTRFKHWLKVCLGHSPMDPGLQCLVDLQSLGIHARLKGSTIDCREIPCAPKLEGQIKLEKAEHDWILHVSWHEPPRAEESQRLTATIQSGILGYGPEPASFCRNSKKYILRGGEFKTHLRSILLEWQLIGDNFADVHQL